MKKILFQSQREKENRNRENENGNKKKLSMKTVKAGPPASGQSCLFKERMLFFGIQGVIHLRDSRSFCSGLFLIFL